MKLQLKRAYEPSAPTDGFRIYVDRLWPRGLSHETFHYNLWDKTIAPSDELRHWFHEDPDNRWTEFTKRYAAELKTNPALPDLRHTIESHPAGATLLYSSHDPDHNNATVLRDVLESKL